LAQPLLRLAQPLRENICQNAERLAAENGLTIEFLRRPKSVRKEDKVQKILRQRGDHPGLVCIFSVMEPCSSYPPWHDKQTGQTYLRPDGGKCLHYYFYLIDEELGLGYVGVPTWCPFRLQIYLNGHHRLSRPMSRQKLRHTLLHNAFPAIEDFDRAQPMADDWPVEKRHRKLHDFALRFCPVIQQLFEALARGEFNLLGLQNRTLRRHLPQKTSGQISRLLRRLRFHGLIKKAGRTCRYYLTHFGKHVITTGLKLQNLVLIPQLAAIPAA